MPDLTQLPTATPPPMSPLLSIMEQLKQKPKTDTDIFKRLERYGLKAPDQLNKEYNDGVDEREGNATGAAAGSVAGIVAGMLLGSFQNNNAAQNINNAMPALTGLSTVAGMNKEGQAKADRDYPVALRNYYDALFRMDEKNDAIGRENRNIDLEMAKTQMRPQDYDLKPTEDGRMGIFSRDGKFLGYSKDAKGEEVQVGENKILKRHDALLGKIRVLSAKAEEVGSEEEKKRQMNELAITYVNDPEMAAVLRAAAASGNVKESLGGIIADMQSDLIGIKDQLGIDADPNDYLWLKKYRREKFKKRFLKPIEGITPKGTSDAVPTDKRIKVD